MARVKKVEQKLNIPLIICLVVLLLALMIWLFTAWEQNQEQINKEIKDFADCVRVGYPVMESYPRSCQTPDGRIFREQIESPETSTPVDTE
jgi:NADH:ubiquinone oxidoreductase subunit 6 (subunit J)